MAVLPAPSAWLVNDAGYAGGIAFEAPAKEAERGHEKLLNSAADAVPHDLSVMKLLAHGQPVERILE